MIQNIIQGADLVMSHITHLYHLSALDFVSASFLGVPWSPSYTASDMLVATGANEDTTANHLVADYVEALKIRRKCHTAGALFSGRQPIQNAMVPGGVSTLFSSTYPVDPAVTDYDQGGPYNAATTKTLFKDLMTEVRTFINTKYIPDVVVVANAYSQYWNVGTGCTNLLSYGDYPVNTSGRLAIKRGLSTLAVSGGAGAFNQANIAEYVNNSHYQYGVIDPASLHPFDGKTSPNFSNGYSWIKAPRLVSGTTVTVCEVGPLARMVNCHLSGDQVPANDTNPGGSNMLGGGTYSVTGLITTALSLCTSSTGETGTQLIDNLFSPLGRHAARALECKYIADLMTGGGSDGWVDLLTADQPCYTYTKIPKTLRQGYGLTEAPRGALGHWVKIEGKRVAKYQCVVPSTWNFSPASGATSSGSKTNRGAVEQSLMDTNIGTDSTSQIINILRVVHPFDCCIACAVHVVNPEGKETLKFAIGPDGRPTNIEVKE